MNFIARNLGWLLLLIFFIFMLFIISTSNDKDIKANQIGAVLTGSITGGQDSLDNLVNKIESEEKVSEGKEIMNKGEEVVSKDLVAEKRGLFTGFFNFKEDNKDLSSSDGNESEEKVSEGKEIMNKGEEVVSKDLVVEKRGLFTGFFNFKEDNKDLSSSDENESEEKVSEGKEIMNKGEENINSKNSSLDIEENIKQKESDTKEDKDSFFSKLFGSDNKNTTTLGELGDSLEGENTGTEEKDSDIVVLKGGNIMKKSRGGAGKVSYKHAPEVGAYNNQYDSTLPGVNLDTKIGNKYEVGVHALKLNNANFTQTLAYMARGDVLKQLGDENIYGCFKIEVINAKNLSNVGKKGYVCKKWLTNSSQKDVIDDPVIADMETQPTTKIGDIITIDDDITIDGVELGAGDKVDQLSELDNNGCAIVLVCESGNTPSLGKVIKYCSKF